MHPLHEISRKDSLSKNASSASGSSIAPRPFLHCGIDFAGPFMLTACRGRGHKSFKGYAAIFVCFATRAVHKEAVSDLSTQAFLAAFHRFTSRRGLCKVIHSDNGTNFQGTGHEIHKLFRATSTVSKEVADALAADGTVWTHTKGPHFDGMWESKVKLYKHHLRKVMSDTKLPFEEFQTLSSQIEACRNSPPLCSLTSDPQDVTALTPGHFLIGGPLKALPESYFAQPESRVNFH